MTRWATVQVWRSTALSRVVQHLVANGGGIGARAVIIAALRDTVLDEWCVGSEAWFRPSNGYPAAVFGTSATELRGSSAT